MGRYGFWPQLALNKHAMLTTAYHTRNQGLASFSEWHHERREEALGMAGRLSLRMKRTGILAFLAGKQDVNPFLFYQKLLLSVLWLMEYL